MHNVMRDAATLPVRLPARSFASKKAKSKSFEAGHVSTAPVEYTQKLEFFGEAEHIIPAFQILDLQGKLIDASLDPKVRSPFLPDFFFFFFFFFFFLFLVCVCVCVFRLVCSCFAQYLNCFVGV